MNPLSKVTSFKKIFLAAQSSSRSLVVGWFVGWSVGLEGFVKKYQIVTKTCLPSYLCYSIDCGDSSDSSDISDSSDSSDQTNFFHQNNLSNKQTKTFFTRKKMSTENF